MKRVPAPIELRMLHFEISRRALREMTSQQRHFLNLDVTYVHPYSRTTYAKKIKFRRGNDGHTLTWQVYLYAAK